MLRWFHALMPKEDRFFGLFDAHAQTLVAGAEALRDLLQGDGAIPAACKRIFEQEEAADAITRDVLLAVRRSFITPFDRGDIKELITSLDDAIDQMQKTAKAVTLFEVTAFEPPMVEMGGIIVRAAELTAEAVALLSSVSNNNARINAVAEEITRIEERADQMYDAGIKALFQAHRSGDAPSSGDAMGFIVGAEIYDHLEKVVDRFEDVANRISGIVIEHV
jgi:predicted phosphate transport protein (TIGR00153 family)